MQGTSSVCRRSGGTLVVDQPRRCLSTRLEIVQSVEELTTWLEADDAKGRAMRAERLRDLLDILPVPSGGLSFVGGEQSLICFYEFRRCYPDGSYMAVVLLCLAFVERELAAQLHATGWERARKANLGILLKRDGSGRPGQRSRRGGVRERRKARSGGYGEDCERQSGGRVALGSPAE